MEDKFLVARSELTDQLTMLLGGRAAEEMIFADPTTGAANDIERATTVARQMVTEYGMSESLGPMRFGQPQGEVFLGRDLGHSPDYSEEVAASIDAEVRRLIESAHNAARHILETNRAVLDRLASDLIEHETLETDRVQQVFADVRPWDGTRSEGAGRAASAAATDHQAAPRTPKAQE
jgi:cell division protease FtsH